MTESTHRPSRIRDFLAMQLAMALVIQPLWAGVALARPENPQVVRGDVHISGLATDHTVIEASNGAIIEYSGFDIGRNESVQFIQPSALAAVMNRILSADPTQIDGSILANGRVYIVNPAGVIFGQDAVVDVAQLVAAAGNLSNDDFIAGIDHFTDVKGDVVNMGSIEASMVALIGEHIANSGVIDADNGLVAMVAGNDVYLSKAGARGFVRIDVSTLGQPIAGTGVEQAGQVDAGDEGHVVMAAGDLYSLAIGHTGATRGSSISIVGGKGGTVEIAGRLDASDRSEGGVGGDIEVLGDKVAVLDADIDASGDAGGGSVHIGGGFQGSGPNTASRTYVSSDATIRADAVTDGDGGEVVVWGDEVTGFWGEISARGGAEGGDGGSAEVSAPTLIARGDVDLSAPKGKLGTLLYDPTDIEIRDGTLDGSDETDANANMLIEDGNTPGQILQGDVEAEPFLVYESEIEGQSATHNIVLQASNDITMNDLTTDSSLDVAAGSSITLTADADNSGAGAFTMLGANDTIKTLGGDVNISGASVSVATIDTTPASAADGVDGGSITLTATGTAGGVTAAGALSSVGGVAITNDGGKGGAITVTTSDGAISVADVDSSGGFGVGNGGDAGEIQLTANDAGSGVANITLAGNVQASGGLAGGTKGLGADITIDAAGAIAAAAATAAPEITVDGQLLTLRGDGIGAANSIDVDGAGGGPGTLDVTSRGANAVDIDVATNEFSDASVTVDDADANVDIALGATDLVTITGSAATSTVTAVDTTDGGVNLSYELTEATSDVVLANGATAPVQLGGTGSFTSARDLSVGDGTATESSIAAAGDPVTLTAAGSVAIDNAIDTNGGDLVVNAGTGITSGAEGDVTTTAAAASSGNATFDVSGTGSIGLVGEVITTGAANGAGAGFDGGDVAITTADGAIGVTNVDSAGGTGTTTGGDGGTISVTANDAGNGASNITLAGNLDASGGAGGTPADRGAGATIAVIADGSIDAATNAGAAEITVDGNSVTLTGNGVGATNSIDIDGAVADAGGASLEVTSTGTGDVDVDVASHQFDATTLTLADPNASAAIDLSGGDAIAVTGSADTSAITAVTTSNHGSDFSFSGGAAVAITGAIATGGGDVSVTAGNGLTSTGAGTITTTAAADSGVDSGEVALRATTGNVALAGAIDATGASESTAAGTAANGGRVEVRADAGSVAVADITASGGAAPGTGGTGGDAAAIVVASTAGGSTTDVTLNGTLTAKGGLGDGADGTDANVGLRATGGSVLDGGTAAPHVVAGGLAVDAAGSVGSATANQQLDTQVASLAGTADGGLFVSNTGNLDVTAVNVTGATQNVNQTGITTSDGAVALSAASSIDILENVTTGGGDVDLTATTGITSMASATIDTSTAADSGLDGGAVTLTDTGTGNIALAGNVVTSGSTQTGAAGTSGGDVSLSTTSGAIAVAGIATSGAAGDTGQAGGAAGGVALHAQGTAKDITLNGQISASGGAGTTPGTGGLVDLVATGSLVDGNADSNNVTAGSLVADLGGDFGTSLARIETAVSNVAISAGGANGIFLDNTGALTVAQITSALAASDIDGLGTDALGAGIDVSTTGALAIDRPIATNGGDVTLAAGTGLTSTANGTITTTATTVDDSGQVVLVNIGTGDVALSGAITTTGAEDASAAGTGANGGHVEILDADGSIAVADITTSGGAATATGTGGTGGDASDILIEALGYGVASSDITLNGALSSLGGAGDTAGQGNDVAILTPGSIVDGTGNATRVQARGLALGAGGSAGTSGNRIHTAVGTLAADVGAGGLFVSNTGDLEIGTVEVDSIEFATTVTTTGITSDAGAVDVAAASAIDVNEDITTGGGDVDLTATTGITSLASATIDTSAAADSGLDGGAVTLSDTGTGNIALAGNVVTSGSTQTGGAGTGGGDVGLSTTSGTIAVANITTSGAAGDTGQAGGDAGGVALHARGTAKDITLNGQITASGGTGTTPGTGGQVALAATGGLVDNNASGADVTADSLVGELGGDFGTVADPIETSVAHLAATAGGSNGVFVSNTGNLEVTARTSNASGNDVTGVSAGSDGVGLVSSGGFLDLIRPVTTNGGDVTLTSATGLFGTTNGTITTTASSSTNASGDVRIDVTGSGNVSVPFAIVTTGAADAAAAGTGADAGQVEIVSNDGSITLANVTASGGAATGTGGTGGDGADVFVEAGGDDVNLNGTITSLGGAGDTAGQDGNVGISSQGGSIVDGAGNQTRVRSGGLLLVATGGSAGTSGNRIHTEVDQLAAAVAGGGLFLTNSGDLAVDSVSVDTSGGPSIFAGIASIDGPVDVAAESSITINELIDAGAGDVTLSATEDINGALATDIASTGDVSLTAQNIGNSSQLDINGGGTTDSALTIVADGLVDVDVVIAGFDLFDVTQQDAASNVNVVQSGGDVIDVNGAAGTSTLFSVNTNSSGADFVYRLQDGSADVAVHTGTTTIGGNGLIESDGDIVVGDSAGTAIVMSNNGDLALVADGAIRDGVAGSTGGVIDMAGTAGTPGALLLQAGSGAGQAGNPLLTTDIAAAAVEAGSGDLYLTNSGAGNLDVTQVSFTDPGPLATVYSVTGFHSGGDVAVVNQAGNIDLSEDVTAGDAVTLTSGAAAGVIDASGGLIDAPGDVTLSAARIGVTNALHIDGDSAHDSILSITANGDVDVAADTASFGTIRMTQADSDGDVTVDQLGDGFDVTGGASATLSLSSDQNDVVLGYRQTDGGKGLILATSGGQLGADAYLTSAGNLQVGNANGTVLSAGGHQLFLGATNVTDGDGTLDMQGGNLLFDSGNAIGTSGSGVEIANVGALAALAGGGGAFFDDASGNLIVGNVNVTSPFGGANAWNGISASNGDVEVDVSGGNLTLLAGITAQNAALVASGSIGGGATVALSSGDLELDAGADIGALGGHLQTTGLGTLAARSDTGSIYVRNSGSGSFAVASVGAIDGVTALQGDAYVRNDAGSIAVDEDVHAQNIVMDATGAITNGGGVLRLVASQLALRAGTGVGSDGNEMVYDHDGVAEAPVEFAASTTSGGVYLQNEAGGPDSDLVITTVAGSIGVDAADDVVIRNDDGSVILQQGIVVGNGGSIQIDTPDTIEFNGVESLSAGQDLLLNTLVAPNDPTVATIFRNEGVGENANLTLEARNGNFEAGVGQKIVTPGDLVIVAGDEATIPDLAGLNVSVTAQNGITIERRAPGDVAYPAGSTTMDTGVDFVGNTITLSTQADVVGSEGNVTFSQADGAPVQNAPTDSTFQAIFEDGSQLTAGDLFAEDGTVLDPTGLGPIGGGILSTQPVVIEEVTLRTGALGQLNNVAAAAKPLWASEVVTYLECSLFEGEDPELVPPECQDILAKEAEGASDPRLGTETAKTAAELYRELFREADPMREALQQAWDDYRPTAPADDLSGAGFRRFVEQQSTYLDALGYLTRLNALFRTVDQMGGGASGELDEWRDVLLDDVAPVGMSPEELKDAIGAGEGEIQASGGNLFASDHLPLDLRDDGAPRVGFRAMLR